jgi:hypothetical protein
MTQLHVQVVMPQVFAARLCLALLGIAWHCLALLGMSWLCLALLDFAWLRLALLGRKYLQTIAKHGPSTRATCENLRLAEALIFASTHFPEQSA